MKKVIIGLGVVILLLIGGGTIGGISLKNDIDSLVNMMGEKKIEITDLKNDIAELQVELNKCVVTYVCDNEVIYTEDVLKGHNVSSIPTVPAKEGYTGSWNNNGNNITGDTIIFSVYTPIKYQVTVKTNLITDIYVEKGITTYTADKLSIDVEKNYNYESSYIYITRNIECNNEGYFIFNNNTYYIDGTYRTVYKDDVNGETVGDATNSFTIDGYTFEHVDDYLHYTATINGSVDEGTMLASIDNCLYKVEEDKIINVIDNSTVATLSERKMLLQWDAYVLYKVSNNKYYYQSDDPSEEEIEITLQDNIFVLNNHNYYCDMVNYELFVISKEEAGYINSATAPQSVEFISGDVVVINNWDYSNVKYIHVNKNQDEYEIETTMNTPNYVEGDGQPEEYTIKYGTYSYAEVINNKLYIFGLKGDVTIYFTYRFSN